MRSLIRPCRSLNPRSCSLNPAGHSLNPPPDSLIRPCHSPIRPLRSLIRPCYSPSLFSDSACTPWECFKVWAWLDWHPSLRIPCLVASHASFIFQYNTGYGPCCDSKPVSKPWNFSIRWVSLHWRLVRVWILDGWPLVRVKRRVWGRTTKAPDPEVPKNSSRCTCTARFIFPKERDTAQALACLSGD